jgi:hypothetical protein
MFNKGTYFACLSPKSERQIKTRSPAGKRLLRWIIGSVIVAFISANGTQVAAAEEDVLVGHSAAGQIKADVQFTPPLPLPVSVYPGISGYATGDMGFHSTILDDPTNDFFILSPAGDFRFVLLAKDPGMEVWNDTGSGYLQIGEQFYVGPAPFDTHPVWNITTGTPGNTYSLTLQFIDLNNIYTNSDPVVLSFTPEVTPGPGPYEINLLPQDSQHVTLLWATNAVGWSLESTTSLVNPSWNTITNTPAIDGTNYSLSISTDAAQEFFRLHRQ